MLIHLLAQLLEHLLAALALVEHLEPAVDLAVEADRAAEDGEVQALHESEDADEDGAVDQDLGVELHQPALGS